MNFYKFCVIELIRIFFGIAFILQPADCTKIYMEAPTIELSYLCVRNSLEESSVECIHGQDVNKFNKEFTFENKTLVMSDDVFRVKFKCVAPYPVEWEYAQDKWHPLASGKSLDILALALRTLTTYSRVISDLNDPLTFNFSSSLILTNHELANVGLGLYTCSGVDTVTSSPKLSDRVSLFKDEDSVFDQAFALSGKNVTVWTEENDDTITFPCYVKKKFVNVTLFMMASRITHWPFGFDSTNIHKALQLMPESFRNSLEKTWWRKIRLNEQLSFRPELGYIFHRYANSVIPGRFQLSPGIYKCVNADSEDDNVVITLEPGSKPANPNNPNVTVKYELIQDDLVGKGSRRHSSRIIAMLQVECCSTSSSSPPENIEVANCYNKLDCDRVQNTVCYQDGKENFQNQKYQKYRSMKIVGNCLQSNISLVSASPSKSNPVWSLPLTVGCSGEGMNYCQSPVFPLTTLNGTVEPRSWEDIDPYTMLRLSPQKNKSEQSPVTVYANQSITFVCKFAAFYFSQGCRMTIDLTDGKHILIPETVGLKDDNVHLFLKVTTSGLTVTRDMKSISCYAPVTHSFQWIKKTVMFDIKDGKPATITGHSEESELTWILHDKQQSLICEFEGIPAPENIAWLKNGETLQITNDTVRLYNYSTSENRSVLEVYGINYDTHGEYTCVVHNLLGSANKTFHIYIEVSETNWTIFSVSVGLLCFLAILLFVAFKTWRTRSSLANVIREPFHGDS